MELSSLISPYGGELVDLLVQPDDFNEVKAHASCLPSLRLSERAVCDLELLTVSFYGQRGLSARVRRDALS
jgi:sulfate adenylyltransferase